MGRNFKLFRIYVWFSAQDNSWAAEGKWWKENEDGVRYLQGTIGRIFFMDLNLSDAIDEVLQAAEDMNIVVWENIRLDYSEKFEFWDEESYGKPNPFPKPENFEELIQSERQKRKWTDSDRREKEDFMS
ncbi:hypothetical protein EHV15_35850 [Paenibacillus oralis]|uniref:Uncharacterized protein n=1 Tax=Paenibacillus oralis TaxID=2490856 RepID=A0A3P3TAB3_9BACL|nr:hypothetical protein [Paenibacillus oralis]RRJ54947.1 hypothetical protein EHV15_35850 [Paenibacillus oralis]